MFSGEGVYVLFYYSALIFNSFVPNDYVRSSELRIGRKKNGNFPAKKNFMRQKTLVSLTNFFNLSSRTDILFSANFS